MLSKDLVDKLKERYAELHPLIFYRSFSRARSDSDLFDILDTVPVKFPIVWSDIDNRWNTTEDIFMLEDFNL